VTDPSAVPPPPSSPPVPAPANPPASAAPPPPKPAVSTPSSTAAKPAAATPPVRPPRSGALDDRGVRRREAVHALRWTVDGSVKVTGEVDVGSAAITGTLAVGGAILADSLVSRGTLDAGGTVSVGGTLSTDGRFHAVGPVTAQSGSFFGVTRIGRAVTVDRSLTVHGQFAAPSVRVNEFRGDGAVEIPGDTEAVTVDVRIRRDSRFGTIRAHTVRLIRVPPNPIEWVFGRSPPTPVARIEADKVELEGVDVAFVRSPEVILGRDAHVTEVEGTVVRRHSTARVGPRSKSPAPYGLSR